MNNIEHFIEIGIALSSEKDHHVLLEKIIKSAMELTNADGGTIYSISQQNELVFETIINKTLQLHLGGTTDNEIIYNPIPILKHGEVNDSALVAIAAKTGDIINIEDVYDCSSYDLSAAKAMDIRTGYKTQSVLTLPMKNHQGDLNGVIQLINASNVQGDTIPFSSESQNLPMHLLHLQPLLLPTSN
jgi:GAF domain-containing protein